MVINYHGGEIMNDIVKEAEHREAYHYALVAGILFIAAFAIQMIIRFINYGGTFFLSYFWLLFRYEFFSSFGNILAAVVLIRNKKDIFPIIAFSLSMLLSLHDLFSMRNADIYVFLINLFCLLSDIAILVILSFACLNGLKKYQKRIVACWFVPAVLMAATVVIELSYGYGFRWILPDLVEVGGVFFASMWAIGGIPQKPAATHAEVTGTNTMPTNNSGVYCDLVKHTLLLLFTFGIWFLIWIYRVTGYTNNVRDEEERNPTTKLLLCLFVPFYQIYWTYKTAQRVNKIAAGKGTSSDLSTLCLILAIFVPIIPPILIQDKMNNIVTIGDAKTTSTQKPQVTDNTVLGAAEELKKYKELLDNGVITQEEFDAKKKQLLGL